ncbi:lipopolysaccharide biosynthesis protein, partial [Francisella tularensis subsp. holarctica]|nr:lipopolysaccharide biosynthesis protein [Francisella tularensis subsp. holarctica]
GITPTLSREVAHVRGSTDDSHYLRKLVRSLELFFIIVGVLVFIVISTHSRYISTSWLHIGSLDADSESVCIALMGLMFALRWVSDLYGG